jgi:hypothetical protein
MERWYAGVNVWRIAFAVCALVLWSIAVSNAAYEITSPATMPHHVLVRKTLAVAAFCLCALLYSRSEFRIRGILGSALAMGAFSLAIEIGQELIDHVQESFGQHAFDVASGAAGGVLGALVIAGLKRRSERVP